MIQFTEPHVLYALVSLGWFSLTDLRFRTTPGVEFFFCGAVLLGLFANPLRVGVVVLAVAGLLGNWRPCVIIPLLFHPSTWMVLLVGTGHRKGYVGGADLLALGGVACLFDWYVPVLALIGVLLWREWWGRRWRGPLPALPGMFLGIFVYLFFLR